MVALRVLPLLQKEAKERQRLSKGRGKKVRKDLRGLSENGEAAEIAARMAKTNRAYVHAVKAIQEQAPDLIDEILAGVLQVPDAQLLAKLAKRQRQKVLRLHKVNPKHKLKRLIRQAELDAQKRYAKRHKGNGTASCKRGNIQVWCGDCIEMMSKKVKSKTVSTVVTSPPFNLGVRYNTYNDNLPLDRYLRWMDRVFKQIKRVLKDDGSFFLNVGSCPSKPLNAMAVAQMAGESFVLQNEIIWVKSIAVDGRTHGHFDPVNSDRFLNHNWESIYHFTKSGDVKLDRLAIGVPYEDKSNLYRNGAGSDLKCSGNVWHIPYETINSRGDKGHHPAVFPVELPERCIKLHGVDETTCVLDSFVGTGSTLIAAKRLGVKAIGIDVDAAYCREARRRLRREAAA